MTDSELMQLSEKVGRALQAQGATVTTAESCTGGWIAKAITDIAGSSAWFERGFVTYSNKAKQQLLGVKSATLLQFGAVSEQTVHEMAVGAQKAAGAGVAVAVSGIAGPGGGSEQKPVGTVWFAFAVDAHVVTTRWLFHGDRASIRAQAIDFALQQLILLLTVQTD